ncbi:acetyltransferase [Acinetobacter sp. NCu2D-2]|uniref:GNAT family N-acetyltransferase n=1 Tax=Acinetobacter sp. NCu2D-2 TaxID=1608473 RepID=UPI0007CDD935|nr:GNAT family N-acetyltransferase [Acinetobacter sp. NCu2D-2]ANF82002.1 acetyltransferase [Acinetobacter sp. NCu2D-2]
MIVRQAQAEDLEKLTILFDEYRQFYGASSNLTLSGDFLEQRFKDGQTVIFINTKDDAFTGFILLYLGFSSVACSTYFILDDVYVTPAFRRQGAARQLINTAILYAKSQNGLRISLETQKNNFQSHELYESMGFMKDNEFQTYHCFLK